MSDLLERLRDWADGRYVIQDGEQDDVRATLHDAKAEIERLQAERDEARREWAETHLALGKAEHKIERLRALLLDAWTCATNEDIGTPFYEQTAKAVRDALKEQGR